SGAPRETSATATTSWPAFLRATTTRKSQLSSARNRIRSARISRLLVGDGFGVGDLVCCERDCSPDVLAAQVRIAQQEIAFRRSLGDASKDEFDRNPSASDDRFAQHDV